MKKMKKISELKDTVELMLSDNYKDRLKAEYYQVKIRLDKLRKVISDAESGTCPFDTKYTIEYLKAQRTYMGQYLMSLKKRAEVERIYLD